MSKFLFPRREFYAPGHFGNSYEVAGRFEMRKILEEAKFWGFNWYGDWFDTVNLTKKSYLPEFTSQCWLKKAIWENKKVHFKEAQKLGFNLDLVITPNHVFADQCREDLLAKQSPKIKTIIQGHLLCPSIPEARRIILENYEEWFKDLSDSDIHLNSITAGAYDFGGCGCEKCNPWILTFAKLSKEIYEIACKYFPDIQMRFCGWYVNSEEHNLFADWVDKNAPGWAKGIALWVKYGEDKPASVPPGHLPNGCKENFFVHIGYADKGKSRDLYGEWGPTIAPIRIPRTLENLRSVDGEGFMAYSEGTFDDINKALLAGLGSGKFESSKEVLEAYAQRYFNAGSNKKEWVKWLSQWGEPFTVNLGQARKIFNRLIVNAPDSWRLQQLASKLRLFELNNEINKETEQSLKRLNKAEEFFKEKERLRRKIYGLSPLEEPVFATIVGLPTWYEDWQEYAPSLGKKISKEA